MKRLLLKEFEFFHWAIVPEEHSTRSLLSHRVLVLALSRVRYLKSLFSSPPCLSFYFCIPYDPIHPSFLSHSQPSSPRLTHQTISLPSPFPPSLSHTLPPVLSLSRPVLLLLQGAWVLRPSSLPVSAVVHFVGGAFVGASPQLTYGLFLRRLAER